MTGEGVEAVSGAEVPEARIGVHGACGEAPTRRVERYAAGNIIRVCLEGDEARVGVEVPDPDRVVPGAGNEEREVRVCDEGDGSVRVPGEAAKMDRE